MQPEKARKTKEREEKLRKGFYRAFHGLTFLLALFVIGPLIHEIAHIGVLQILSCTHRELIEASFYGIYGTVEPLCELDIFEQGLFYTSGYISTILVGSTFTFFSVKRTGKALKVRDYLASAGSGILLSMIIPLTSHGDFRILASALGLPDSVGMMVSLIVLLTASSLGLRELEINFDTSER